MISKNLWGKHSIKGETEIMVTKIQITNGERLFRLQLELLNEGYNDIAAIFHDIAISCPRYAAQVDGPCVFKNSVTDILNGLSLEGLEIFIDTPDELLRVHEIIIQAKIVKNFLCHR